MLIHKPTNKQTILLRTPWISYWHVPAILYIIKSAPKGDIILIMGDFNAKIGQESSGIERVMGNLALGDRNSNFCTPQQLTIAGPLLPHKTWHNITWMSPDGHTKNQNRGSPCAMCATKSVRTLEVTTT